MLESAELEVVFYNAEVHLCVRHVCTGRFYGVTYKEDKENVMRAFREFKVAGLYPKGF